jgi:hypothetical protein
VDMIAKDGAKVIQRNVEQSSDVVSTPEGDEEFLPDEPVGPAEGLQIPQGGALNPYDTDEAGEVKETVDKLSIGQILT